MKTVRAIQVLFLTAGALAAQPSITAVTSAASFDGRVAFGGYAAVFGSGLADGAYTSPDANYGTKLGGTEIFLCTVQLFTDTNPSPGTYCQPARIVFASPGQVNVVMPAAKGFGMGDGWMFARVAGVLSPAARARVDQYSPSVFMAGSDCMTSDAVPQACGLQPGAPGQGRARRGIVTDLSGNLIWSGNRAHAGGYYTAWLTGMGVPPVKGQNAVMVMDVAGAGYPPTNPTYEDLNLTYAGAVPQFPGLWQINFQIPVSAADIISPFTYEHSPSPCGNYNWEMTVRVAEGVGVIYSEADSNIFQIPLAIRNGDVPCTK